MNISLGTMYPTYYPMMVKINSDEMKTLKSRDAHRVSCEHVCDVYRSAHLGVSRVLGHAGVCWSACTYLFV